MDIFLYRGSGLIGVMDIIEGTKMKLGRLVIPAIAAIAVVLLGTLTGRLVLTGPILATEPIPIELPEPPDKAGPVERSAAGDPLRSGSRPGPGAGPHLGGRRPDDAGGAPGRPGRPEDRRQQARGCGGVGGSRGQRRPEAGQARPRRSPGVPLRVGSGADDAAGRRPAGPGPRLGRRPGFEGFFSQNEIPAERVSELGFLRNGFLIETRTGLPVAGAGQRAGRPGGRPDLQSQLADGG